MNKAEKRYNYFKQWWSDKKNPHHRHNTEEWFDAYYKEFRFHFGENCRTIVDAGCGSGEMTLRMAKDFDFVYGIDYSDSMVAEAKKQASIRHINNVQITTADMVQMDKVLEDNSADIVFCNGTVQYLSKEQLNTFLAKCKKIVKPGGKILLMNIPNLNLRNMLIAKVFHDTDQYISLYKIAYRNLINRAYLLKQRLLNRDIVSDGTGYWFTEGDIKNLAEQNGLKVQFYNSMYPPYGYRFHARLS